MELARDEVVSLLLGAKCSLTAFVPTRISSRIHAASTSSAAIFSGTSKTEIGAIVLVIGNVRWIEIENEEERGGLYLDGKYCECSTLDNGM